MGLWLVLVLLGAGLPGGWSAQLKAASPLAGPLASALDTGAAATATSRSQQFIVHGRPPPAAKYGRMRNAEELNPILELQPQSLAITAERVQLAVLNRLGSAPTPGRGRFHLFIIPTNRFGAGPLEIIPRAFREGWQYHVGIPESVDWRRLIRGLSEAVLLELANREGGDTLARTPLWLNEGLAGIIEIEEGRSLIQEPEAAVVRAGRRGDPLAESRVRLTGQGTLNYSELSQPSLSLLSDTNQFARFQASSILFTQQLLGEEKGPARLRQAVVLSPQFLNWEFALLRAFEGRFVSALDIEKWWALGATVVLSRDPLQRWSRGQTLERLRAVTLESTSLQTQTNAPATRRQVTLPELLIGLEFPAQKEVLDRKLGQLRELYRQAPDDLLPLIEDYFRSLENYLNLRQNSGGNSTGRGAMEVRAQLLARQTARRLVELDRKLDALK